MRRSFFVCSLFFFFNDTATTEIYTLSLHDALPIRSPIASARSAGSICDGSRNRFVLGTWQPPGVSRSEEHTSELQSRRDLVCRLLLEKKKKNKKNVPNIKQKKKKNKK